MRFAIYIPGDDINNEQKLVAVGLSHLVSGAMGLGASPGPDGKRGIVFSWPQDGSPVGYFPDRQKWIPAYQDGDRTAGRYWVGFSNSSPPTPRDLAWRKQFDGHDVVLGDGNTWKIPCSGMLPQTLRMGRDGRSYYEIREQYQSYFNESAEWMKRLATQETEGLVRELSTDIFKFVEKAISLNYMVTTEVVSELALIGSDNLKQILFAIFDQCSFVDPSELEAAQKKSEAALAT